MFKPTRCLLGLGVLSQLFIACKKDDEPPPLRQTLTIASLSGYVQKGPFISGTNIAISELDNRLAQTGKVFSTNIKNDQGGFSAEDLKLNSQYVELRANGFYFNEVSGKLSTAQLGLEALADVSHSANVNVNLLTHLEKGRIEHLIRNEKKSFAEAKQQAQQEVLAVFRITKANMAVSEQLNIAQAGDDNAILLAVSAIMQGTRAESELSERLSKISLDIQEDGKLDNAALRGALLKEAVLLDAGVVSANVVKRYADLGVTVNVGDFKTHIDNFIARSTDTLSKKIEYPAGGRYGLNLLATPPSLVLVPKASDYKFPEVEHYSGSYSLAALAPIGTSARVKVSLASIPADPAFATFTTGELGLWKRTSGNASQQELLADRTMGELADGSLTVHLRYSERMLLRIEVYENNSDQPTRVRDVLFAGDADGPGSDVKISYPGMPIQFGNLLDSTFTTFDPEVYFDPASYSRMSGIRCYLIAEVPQGRTLKVRITSTAQPGQVSKFNIVTDTNEFGANMWRRTAYNYEGNTEVQELEVISAGYARCNIIPLPGQAVKSATIEIFENGAFHPTRVTKVVNWR